MIPIFPDRNVGPAAYKAIAEHGKLLVSNVFFTFQGEGPYAGQPAVFVRLSGCNLGSKSECPWCDADYRFDKGAVFSASNLAARIRFHDKARLIVLTGGEPLLQMSSLVPVMIEVERLNRANYTWQFETNGVLLDLRMIEDLDELGLDFFFVISPKIIGGKYQPLPDFLEDFVDRVALKYIVSADPDSSYHKLPTYTVPHNTRIYLSGQTEYGPGDVLSSPGLPVSLFRMSEEGRQRTSENWAYAAKLALDRGYRVSLQTHLLAGVE